MISDVLSDASHEILTYLTNSPESCDADTRQVLLSLCDHMDLLRKRLDTPPAEEGDAP